MAEPRKAPAKKAAAKKTPAAKKPPAKRAAKASAPRASEDAPRARVEKIQVVFPKSFYEPHKDEIKAPFKAHDMKWNYLGEGKGLYKREKAIHCFVQFQDDGTHYSIWGDDKKGVSEILATWKALAGAAQWATFTAAGETATKVEAEVKESEALRAWKLQEPHARPGEPEFFFKTRKDEWLAKKPT